MAEVLKYSIPLPVRNASISRGRHSLRLVLHPIRRDVKSGAIALAMGIVGLPLLSLLLVIPLIAIKDFVTPRIGVALLFIPMALAAATFLWSLDRFRGSDLIIHANRYRLLIRTPARSRHTFWLASRQEITLVTAAPKASSLEVQLRDGAFKSIGVNRSPSEVEWISIHVRDALGIEPFESAQP